MDNKQKNKKTRMGVVVSNKMTNSIVVNTERKVRHKLYGKMLRLKKKYMADDPDNTCDIGDVVLIEECRPISKNKRWRLREVIEKVA